MVPMGKAVFNGFITAIQTFYMFICLRLMKSTLHKNGEDENTWGHAVTRKQSTMAKWGYCYTIITFTFQQRHILTCFIPLTPPALNQQLDFRVAINKALTPRTPFYQLNRQTNTSLHKTSQQSTITGIYVWSNRMFLSYLLAPTMQVRMNELLL